MSDAAHAAAPTPLGGLVILGQPVAQSLSPVFQNAALEAVGIPVVYGRREVSAEQLDDVLDECRAANCGGNVTMPHKAAVFARAAHCTGTAARTGAVNTFWWEQGALVGHNTDVHGIAATVRALCGEHIAGDVVLLGAGGSAAAVLVALEPAMRETHGSIIVHARTDARASALVERVQSTATVQPDLTRIEWSRVALVINATPQGMHAQDALPIDVSILAPHTALFDLVYKREGTRWVNEARAGGRVAEDGLRMLVEQGAAAFEAWFATAAPREVMWRALGHTMPSPTAPRG